ncbi:hypothetical protein ACFQO4_10965 [Saliphagus sp. GCM10025334]
MALSRLRDNLSPLAWWILVLSTIAVGIALVGTVILAAEFGAIF